jgi:hypothetical protein
LKSAIVGGRRTDLSGISIDGGAIALDVIASASGGVVEGIVTDLQGQPVADAVIVAAPEVSQRLRDDHFHKTASDQNGRFSLHGIAPGQYSLFARDNVEGDAYYDPEFSGITTRQVFAHAPFAKFAKSRASPLPLLPHHRPKSTAQPRFKAWQHRGRLAVPEVPQPAA